ncbi:MAG: hypothetical protein IPN17_36590 [Deltaproteobacteria bacterium]|nr:hypothetical protein [Deltaproteobacteria bacterium]
MADFDRDGNQEVLLACDFGPQLALRVRADGAVEHLPDFFPPHPGW